MKRVDRVDDILGFAIHAGTEQYHHWLQGGGRGPAPDDIREGCVEAAKAAVASRLLELVNNGRETAPWIKATVEKLADRAVAMVTYYCEVAPIPDTWEVLAVEHTLPSGSRMDLGVRVSGVLNVVDLKSSLSWDLRNADKKSAEWRIAPQFHHYAYEWGQELGEDITNFRVIQCSVEPKPQVTIYPFVIQPESAATWLQSSTEVWREMDAIDRGERRPYQRRNACMKGWGKCEMYAMCHDYFEDETLALGSGDYILRKKGEPAV